MKVDLTDHLGSQWNISLNKIPPYAVCMEKYEFKSTMLFTHQKRKINNFFSKYLPPQNIVPYLMFIIWNLSHFLKIEYSLIGIIKPKFTRGNEI